VNFIISTLQFPTIGVGSHTTESARTAVVILFVHLSVSHVKCTLLHVSAAFAGNNFL